MTIWVGIGIALMILGVYSSVWVTFLGACVIGSTPVFFTLRAALAPQRRAPKPSSHRIGKPAHPPGSGRTGRRTPPRRRDHG